MKNRGLNFDNAERISNFLSRIIYILLLFFPFSMATIYGIVCLFSRGGWTWLLEGHNKNFYVLSEFRYKAIAFLIIAAVIMVVGKIVKYLCSCFMSLTTNRKKNTKIVTAVGIFLVSIIIRMVLICIFYGEVHPFSDFLYAWHRAVGDKSSLTYYGLFPAYVNWSMVERMIIHLAGYRYEAVLFFCIFCNAITSAFLFLITDDVFGKYSMAILASIIYIINPSSIAYTLISTSEHMAIACFTGSIYLICKYFDTPKYSAKVCYLFLAGAIGGIGNSVKTFFPVAIIAMVIVLILGELLRNNALKIKTIVFCIFSVAVLFLSYKVTVNGVTAISENIFGVELNFADSTPHYLNVGLNRQGEGQITNELSMVYLEDRLDGVPFGRAKEHAIELVMSDWKENMNDIPEFLLKKTIWIWQDDYQPFRYFMNNAFGLECNTFIENVVYKIITTVGTTYSQLWYILTMFLGIVGAVFILKRENADIKNNKFMLTNLMILGFFCMMLLSEAQSRYKCLILPFVCIIDAYAGFTIYDIVRVKLKFR